MYGYDNDFYSCAISTQLLVCVVTFLFIFPVSLKFVIAQTPGHMRGMMIGMWMASIGIGSLII